MKVNQIMHEGADWCPPETSVIELARRMRDEDIGSIPIGENDRLVGMVTDRDITVRAVADNRDLSSTTAREVMTSDMAWCYDDSEVAEAGRVMADRGVRRRPVINRDKRLVGILSIGDLTAASPEVAGETLRALSAVEGRGPTRTAAS